jgi:nicotinamidase-related amidase
MTNAALLVMDIQNAITTRVQDSHYLRRLAGAVNSARNAGIPVMFVVVGFRPGRPEISARNKSFSLLPPGAFTDDDPGTAIHPDLAPQPGDVVITKKRVSAFAGSDLELVLRSGGIDHLILTGITTSGVVLSTVRQAADLDYQLTILADGCYDTDPDIHQLLTERLFPRQARVATIEAWLRTIG